MCTHPLVSFILNGARAIRYRGNCVLLVSGYTFSNPTAYKWTSLEGLRHQIYTIEGDVWSYGIVLAEISSLGDVPYMQFRNFSMEFVDFLKGGGRMEKGRGWLPVLYETMASANSI